MNRRIHTVLSFLFLPAAALYRRLEGPEEAKNLAGENVLRLIQIRLTTSSFEEIAVGCQGDFYLGHFTYRLVTGWLWLETVFGLIAGRFTYR